ncbi:hypothetical protein [Noviherbaspirillum humi]|uniref:hypothetical protein n=1 Tax=Noviherbaspirillum humi TaxID=1688639 RepID=UPI001160DA8E|nr:hypothetical protein [Noviherbaspirillum humi]
MATSSVPLMRKPSIVNFTETAGRNAVFMAGSAAGPAARKAASCACPFFRICIAIGISMIRGAQAPSAIRRHGE